MFVEPQIGRLSSSEPPAGWIEVICGCMFSGKTEELIRRLNRAIIAKQVVRIFKPTADNRYHPHDVVSHDQNRIPSMSVAQAQDLLELTTDCRVVGIERSAVLQCGHRLGMQPAGQPRQARDRGGPRHGLRGAAVRPDAQPDGRGRVRYQGARDLYGVGRSGLLLLPTVTRR